MSRTREMIFMGIGVLTGFALCGPAAQAATAALTASPTSQTFYVNGQKMVFEAYSIHGNNFVKLRDVGKAVDFGVTYDAATNSVHIDPDSPYTEEVKPTPAPSGVTEESVQATLMALKDRYPNNTPYPSPYRSTSSGPYGMAPSNCAGWATLCSDAAFGSLPWRQVSNPRWDEIRVGDLISYDNASGGHVIVVVSRTDDTISFTDSSTTQKVYWGGSYPRWWLEQQPGLTLYTRYPE